MLRAILVVEIGCNERNETGDRMFERLIYAGMIKAARG